MCVYSSKTMKKMLTPPEEPEPEDTRQGEEQEVEREEGEASSSDSSPDSPDSDDDTIPEEVCAPTVIVTNSHNVFPRRTCKTGTFLVGSDCRDNRGSRSAFYPAQREKGK